VPAHHRAAHAWRAGWERTTRGPTDRGAADAAASAAAAASASAAAAAEAAAAVAAASAARHERRGREAARPTRAERAATRRDEERQLQLQQLGEQQLQQLEELQRQQQLQVVQAQRQHARAEEQLQQLQQQQEEQQQLQLQLQLQLQQLPEIQQPAGSSSSLPSSSRSGSPSDSEGLAQAARDWDAGARAEAISRRAATPPLLAPLLALPAMPSAAPPPYEEQPTLSVYREGGFDEAAARAHAVAVVAAVASAIERAMEELREEQGACPVPDCAICLGTATLGEPQMLGCGHLYCRPCIAQHALTLLRSRREVCCPACKFSLPEEEVAVLLPPGVAEATRELAQPHEPHLQPPQPQPQPPPQQQQPPEPPRPPPPFLQPAARAARAGHGSRAAAAARRAEAEADLAAALPNLSSLVATHAAWARSPRQPPHLGDFTYGSGSQRPVAPGGAPAGTPTQRRRGLGHPSDGVRVEVRRATASPREHAPTEEASARRASSRQLPRAVSAPRLRWRASSMGEVMGEGRRAVNRLAVLWPAVAGGGWGWAAMPSATAAGTTSSYMARAREEL